MRRKKKERYRRHVFVFVLASWIPEKPWSLICFCCTNSLVGWARSSQWLWRRIVAQMARRCWINFDKNMQQPDQKVVGGAWTAWIAQWAWHGLKFKELVALFVCVSCNYNCNICWRITTCSLCLCHVPIHQLSKSGLPWFWWLTHRWHARMLFFSLPGLWCFPKLHLGACFGQGECSECCNRGGMPHPLHWWDCEESAAWTSKTSRPP